MRTNASQILTNNPVDDARIFFNQGCEAQHKGDDDTALAHFTRSLQMQDSSVTHSHFAMSLRYLNRFNDAYSYINDCLERFPGDPWLRYQRALTLLQLGIWTEGWKEYELRIDSPFHPARPMWRPRWNGEAGDVCVYSEQGVGDEIMFSSCLRDLLRDIRGRLYLECSRKMVPLFQNSFPDAVVYSLTLDALKGNAKYDLPIGSLPSIYRNTDAEFARNRGAYLHAGIVHGDPLPVIGVCWRGGTLSTRQAQRSINPFYLLPALSEHTGRVYHLQHDATPEEIADIQRRLGIDLNHNAAEFLDFLALAKRVKTCDLVVTVCSSIAHLSGALGVPCICLTPYVPEWRYGIPRAGTVIDRMPWYESVRLYRQDELRHWFPVIERLATRIGDGTLTP